jgi:hypothetical protein
MDQLLRPAWLVACCAFAEGAAAAVAATTAAGTPAQTVAAVVTHPDICRLHGREGLPRSTGSVYAASIALFLSRSSEVALPSGELKAVHWADAHVLLAFAEHAYQLETQDNTPGLSRCDKGVPRLFAADADGIVCLGRDDLVQELTPDWARVRRSFRLRDSQHARALCIGSDIIVLQRVQAYYYPHGGEPALICTYLDVFDRTTGSLRAVTAKDSFYRERSAFLLAYMPRCRAVAAWRGSAFEVYALEGVKQGAFVRGIIGDATLREPVAVACSAWDELVVADAAQDCVFVFSGTGARLATLGGARYSHVAVRGSVVFAAAPNNGFACFFAY